MALQYIAVAENDLSLGIDARSSENQLEPGFVQDLLNADVVEKRVRKRLGYTGYAGDLPVRVTQLEYIAATTQVLFTLDTGVSIDSAVSLTSVRPSPLVAYGRSSNLGTGPFSTSGDAGKYYPTFTIPVRKTLTAPSGTLTVLGSEHGLNTTNLFVGVVESTDPVNRSYTQVNTSGIAVNTSNYNVTVGYSTYVNRDIFMYYKDVTPTAGQSYVATLSHGGGGSQTFTITAGTHNLTNFNIIAQVQQLVGGTREFVNADSLTISTSGTVVVSLNTTTANTFYLLLTAAPVTQFTSGVVNASSTGTVVIPALTSDFLFTNIFLEQTPGGTIELVGPESGDYNSETRELTLTFINSTPDAKNFIIHYDYGQVRSNRLSVTDAAATVDGIDTAPQLTLWGLVQDEIYPLKQAHEGWVNHIDSYRRPGEQRLVSGLGGNLFTAREYSEVATAYLLPSLNPSLSGRVATSIITGPTFYATGTTPARTRGYITGDSVTDTNFAQATSVAYDSGTGDTIYTLSLPGKLILDSTGTPTTLSSVINTNDYLEVSGMSYERHNGIFPITQIIDGSDQIQVYVTNADNLSDYDDAGTSGQVGIFTDSITFLSTSYFIPDDILLGSSVGTSTLTVTSSTDSSIVCRGNANVLQIPAGVLITGSRVSSVVPLRTTNPNGISSVDNLVRGDMITYTDLARLLRVKNINPMSDASVSIAAGVVTLLSGSTSNLAPGQKILIINAGSATGVHTVSSIDSSLQITLDSTVTTASGTLAGETAEVDEELSWSELPGDETGFLVARRWIPVEAPDDSFGITPSTHVRYFDASSYTTQEFIRSVMVADTMFLTNNEDSVLKFDGTSIYRAGLPAWQPGLFLTQETSGARIVINNRSIAYSTSPVTAGGYIPIAQASTNVIPVGTSVHISGSTQTYTVRGYEDVGVAGSVTNIIFDRSLDSGVSATGSITEIATFSYYFRLNAVDANNNVVASAAAQSQDYRVELGADAGVRLKLIGMPVLDTYDFDRLEVQIYRTKQSQAAPFYLVTTLPLDFNNTTGYLEYLDSFADVDLTQLDPVNTALLGTELGTNWSGPIRGKHTTSVGNRLYLANLTAYPQLDMQIVSTANLGNSTIAGGSLLFRRDDTDTATTTDMLNRVKYQWVNGFTGTASSFSIGTNQFSFTTSAGTSASAGDWIYLTYSTVAVTGRPLTYCGWWQIVSAVSTTVTVNLTGAASTTAYPDKYVIATDPTDVPVLLGVDGSLGMFNGDSFDTFDAMRRMGLAISATMRMTDTSLSTGFTPWLTSRSGNDVTPAGRLIVTQPAVEDTNLSVVPTFSGYSLFINNIKYATGTNVSASTAVFPSRVIASYENYPEIFDSPDASLDSDSASAIDVNASDGQEITGVVPFFGSAAFTAAQQAAVVVVFKTNSIYLIDFNEKALGRNPVQKIETEGLGCTVPYSIAATKKGIMFANQSGIYCLRRDQSIEYLGKHMERNWTENVSLANLSIAQGHHYGIGRMYKLSVPYTSTISTSTGYVENSEVFVYNHTGEDEGRQGAWGRYDNHAATGWANLDSDAFFASSNGRVYQLRNTGLLSDYRDDSEGVSMKLDTRSTDFGNAGVRKVVDKVIISYRSGATATGTVLSYAVDTEETYNSTTPFQVTIPVDFTESGSTGNRSIATIRHSVGRRRCIYFSVRLENGTIDENVEIAGIQYIVGGLTSKGITQAAQTVDEAR